MTLIYVEVMVVSQQVPPSLLKTSAKLVVKCQAISTDGMRNKPRIPIFVMF